MALPKWFVELDVETHYDKEYSLKNMTTWQYIRDPRFKLLGCAISINRTPTKYVTNLDALGEVLRKLQADGGVHAVAHNASFDAAVLWHVYQWRPDYWTDTLALARYAVACGHLPHTLRTNLAALGEHYGLAKGDTEAALAAGGQAEADYATRDVEIMQRVFDDCHRHALRLELDLMDMHVNMAAYPVIDLDVPLLEELAQGEQIPEALAAACRSRDKFVQLLERAGVEVEYKTTATGKEGPAVAKTDPFMQRLLKHDNPVVRKLAETRLAVASNIKRTRSQRFLDTGAPFPMPLWYHGAHTGRAAGMDKLNVQNLPSNGDAGRIRHALRAQPGHKLVIVDSSQIEVRVLAWLAQCDRLLSVFRDGGDPYREFGALRYGVTPEQVTDAQRKLSKAAVLALGFGQGPVGFMGYCDTFGVPLEGENEARDVVQTYRRVYPEIPQHWKAVMTRVVADGSMALTSGRHIQYPNLRNDGREIVFDRPAVFSKRRDGDTVKLWHGLATENQVQAEARDVVMWQTMRLAQKGYNVVLMVHDEAVLHVPEAQAEQALNDALVAFGVAPPWTRHHHDTPLPVAGEGQISDHYLK